MKDRTKTVLLLHLAVFLAGWTGVFGRIITLSGLPLVWYRIMVSIIFAAFLFGETREVGPSFWTGISLVVISVVLQTRRIRQR